MFFKTTVWSSGKPNNITGAGFGIRIPKEIKENIFSEQWRHVLIKTNNHSFKVDITPGFWNKCNELRNPQIGLWLIENKLNHWKSGFPSEVGVEYLGNQDFKLTTI
ncbi:hypothetical protein NQT65_08745 [Pseudoalteromonas agarivorans]|uniref:hypothetical protein n=1 Tax=Pseudoalteromonas agarivorans TaxID=176102 RepID=UPI0021175261|nr:hypothetical protein [Pseudoalteromonas agarivorans]MCQ8820289.1 hypothetical protein [Pseudoalteromonas agarivorans]